MRDNDLKPVKEIELDDTHIKRKVIIIIIAAIIALGAFIFAVYKIINKDKGWNTITANSEKYQNIDNDFVFSYYVSRSNEYREVSSKYSTYLEYAKTLLDTSYDVNNNMKYINSNPNTDILVDELLYQSLENILDDNYLYLAPINYYYEIIIDSVDTLYDEKKDPKTNDEIKKIINELLAFINNKDKVELKLLGNNMVNLYVSNDYLSYLKDNDIPNIISFGWLLNGYILDYVSNQLSKDGFKRGIIRTYDGFSKCFDDVSYNYNYSLFDDFNGNPGKIGSFKYNGGTSIINLKDFIIYNKDNFFMKIMPDSSSRTYYISDIDGISKAATKYLITYSHKSCVENAKIAAQIFIDDEFDKELIMSYKNDYNFIWYEKTNVMYTEKDLTLDISFKTSEYEYVGVNV